jgi:hypothetical protein
MCHPEWLEWVGCWNELLDTKCISGCLGLIVGVLSRPACWAIEVPMLAKFPVNVGKEPMFKLQVAVWTISRKSTSDFNAVEWTKKFAVMYSLECGVPCVVLRHNVPSPDEQYLEWATRNVYDERPSPVVSSKTLTLWCVCPTVMSVLPYHPIAHPSQQFGTDIILAASCHSPATSACASSSDSSFVVQGTFRSSRPQGPRAILVVPVLERTTKYTYTYRA